MLVLPAHDVAVVVAAAVFVPSALAASSLFSYRYYGPIAEAFALKSTHHCIPETISPTDTRTLQDALPFVVIFSANLVVRSASAVSKDEH